MNDEEHIIYYTDVRQVVTRTCSICNQHEYNQFTALSLEFWVCPKCCEKLKKLINIGEIENEQS